MAKTLFMVPVIPCIGKNIFCVFLCSIKVHVKNTQNARRKKKDGSTLRVGASLLFTGLTTLPTEQCTATETYVAILYRQVIVQIRLKKISNSLLS